jgi:predicted transcriptional regulator
MSNKELVIETVRKMPDDSTLDEISEEIAIFAAIRRGEKAADEGRMVPHEEAMQRLSKWTTT